MRSTFVSFRCIRFINFIVIEVVARLNITRTCQLKEDGKDGSEDELRRLMSRKYFDLAATISILSGRILMKCM